MNLFYSRFIALLMFAVFSNCGVNTDSQVNPYLLILPPGTPQIAHIIPINTNYDDNYVQSLKPVFNPRQEFLIQYYITNIEPQYVGNNVYISATSPTIAETYNNLNNNLYLENGVAPSFVHSPDTASNTQLVTRRISYLSPPPNIVYLAKCEIFSFTMRSLLNSGVLSNPSAPVSGCVSQNPSSCLSSTSCNPISCQNPFCGNPSSCPVGTLCNPCKISGREATGCPCPEGVSPPGCN